MSGTTPLSPLVTAIVQRVVAELNPFIRTAIEIATLTAICVPVLLAVVYFSTPASRATLMWRLVVAELLYGIAIGIYGIYIYVRTSFSIFRFANAQFASAQAFGPILDPFSATISQSSDTFIALAMLTPWLIDWILFTRIISVFPARSTPLGKFLRIISFPICIKIARLGVLIAFIIEWDRDFQGQMAKDQLYKVSWKNLPLPKTEMALSLFDNG
jgi:hypothetical protein